MKEQLITFETAKLAKEKGFDWMCEDGYYEDNGDFWEDWDLYLSDHYKKRLISQNVCGAPTQSLLQKWLREKHQLSVCVDFRDTNTSKVEGINQVYYDVMIYRLSGGDAHKKHKINEISDIYEKALERGLQEALKLIP